MLSDIVKEILDEPDIHVAAEFPLPFEGTQVRDIVGAGPDVVILNTSEGGLPPAARALLARQPHAKVLAMRNDGRQTSLYELRPHETDLGQISPETLLQAVRTVHTAPL
jgi:hypothetical protein